MPMSTDDEDLSPEEKQEGERDLRELLGSVAKVLHKDTDKSARSRSDGIQYFVVENPVQEALRFSERGLPDEGLVLSSAYYDPILSQLSARTGLNKDEDVGTLPELLAMWNRSSGPFDEENTVFLLEVEQSLLEGLKDLDESGFAVDLSGMAAPAPAKIVLCALLAFLAKLRDTGSELEVEGLFAP